MDLLEFGMENIESDSVVKRTLAKGALVMVKKGADLYERYLEEQEIEIPDDLEADEAMFARILEQGTEKDMTE